MGMLFGYARVSTEEQSPQMQIDSLERCGCDEIFVDKCSGAQKHRPELDRMLSKLRSGDSVVVWKLDRLGRSLQNLVELMNQFNSWGVQFRSITESIDTGTSGGVLIFNVFASLAQFERDLIAERTRAGLEAARARGREGGRPTKLDAKKVAEIRRLYDSGAVTAKRIGELTGVSRSTVYRALNKK